MPKLCPDCDRGLRRAYLETEDTGDMRVELMLLAKSDCLPVYWWGMDRWDATYPNQYTLTRDVLCPRCGGTGIIGGDEAALAEAVVLLCNNVHRVSRDMRNTLLRVNQLLSG